MTHPSRIATIRTLSIVALCAGALAGTPADACEFTPNPWGLQITDCQLSDFDGRYDVTLDRSVGPPPHPRPNLRPTDVDATVVGSSVNLSAELVNDGARAVTRAFEVVVVASTHDALQKGISVGMTMLPPATLQGLGIGAGAKVGIGTIVLPNRKQDWDVCSVAIVDPPLAGSTLGSLLESNESDNQIERCCRVFGPNPDLNGPPAC